MMTGRVGSSTSCGTLWLSLEDLCTDAATSSKDSASEAHHLIFQTPVSLGQTLCGQRSSWQALTTHTDLKSS